MTRVAACETRPESDAKSRCLIRPMPAKKEQRKQPSFGAIYVVMLAVLLLVAVYVMIAWSPWWYGWR